MPGVKAKVCHRCGAEFLGGNAAKWCADCKAHAKRDSERAYSRKRTRIRTESEYSIHPCECGNLKRKRQIMCDPCAELPQGVADVA